MEELLFTEQAIGIALGMHVIIILALVPMVLACITILGQDGVLL
jgi:hypothetical protein